jgi:predicted F0F1-ATPase subunit
VNDKPAETCDPPYPTQQQPEKKPDDFWRLVARATSLGWDLVVPIVGGVLLGRYLDDTFDKEFTWTLSLLLGGVAVAFNNLYAMYIEHSDAEPLGTRVRKKHQKKPNKGSKEGEDHAENQQTKNE